MPPAKPKDTVLDKIGPELGGALVGAVAADMERARLANEKAAKAKKKAAKKARAKR